MTNRLLLGVKHVDSFLCMYVCMYIRLKQLTNRNIDNIDNKRKSKR